MTFTIKWIIIPLVLKSLSPDGWAFHFFSRREFGYAVETRHARQGMPDKACQTRHARQGMPDKACLVSTGTNASMVIVLFDVPTNEGFKYFR